MTGAAAVAGSKVHHLNKFKRIGQLFKQLAKKLKDKAGRVTKKTSTGDVVDLELQKPGHQSVEGVANTIIPLKLKQKAMDLEAADGGHSLDRHGPEVSDALLQRRATTGMSPDNKWSPTHYATKFDSYDEWLKTREDAISQIQQVNQVNFGANMDIPPEPGAPTNYKIEIDHGRAIDSGFVGVGPRSPVVNPYNNSQTRSLHVKTEEVSGITKSYSKVAWDSQDSRWKVVQHFPVGKNWNQALQTYDP